MTATLEEQIEWLQSALKVAQQGRDESIRAIDKMKQVGLLHIERAEKAEADHKAAEQNVSDLMAEVAQTGSLLMKAEERNKRMVELLKELRGWVVLSLDADIDIRKRQYEPQIQQSLTDTDELLWEARK